jgi:hypothetical protein
MFLLACLGVVYFVFLTVSVINDLRPHDTHDLYLTRDFAEVR